MSETKRTPGEWEVGETEDALYTIMAYQDKFGCYALVGECECKRDAEYICRVVNCHERLVGIVRQFSKHLENEHLSDTVGLGYTKALIAEAEGDGNE